MSKHPKVDALLAFSKQFPDAKVYVKGDDYGEFVREMQNTIDVTTTATGMLETNSVQIEVLTTV